MEDIFRIVKNKAPLEVLLNVGSNRKTFSVRFTPLYLNLEVLNGSFSFFFFSFEQELKQKVGSDCHHKNANDEIPLPGKNRN